MRQIKPWNPDRVDALKERLPERRALNVHWQLRIKGRCIREHREFRIEAERDQILLRRG